MNLLKISFYTSISQGISVIGGLISIKIVSSHIGPEGIAMMGQYLNTTALLGLFASGAISMGVVKYLAEYAGDKAAQLSIIRTAIWVSIISSLLIGLLAILVSPYLSRQSFKTEEYYVVYILWGCFLTLASLSALFGNILNGLKLISYLTIVNIISTVIGLFITIFLAYKYGVFGVLIAANFTAIVLFSIHLFFLNKYKWFSFKELFFALDSKFLRLFGGFVLMALVSGILTPSIQLLVRDKIIRDFSFNEAGYWQSVTRISDYYLSFITTVIAVYYLPRLSEIKTNLEIKAEIWKMYKVIMPIVIGVSLLIWLCRYIIIRLILTEEFLPSASLYGFQFIGDAFKIASWLLGYILLAKALKSAYILTEILFSCFYVFICYFFIDQFGVIGAVYGFFISYLLFWMIMLFLMNKYLR